MNKYVLLFFIVAFHVGCASPGVIPKEANLFQAVGNIMTGEFDRQIEQKQSRLNSSKDLLAIERGNSYMLGEELASETLQIRELREKLADMRVENSQLERAISSLDEETEEKKRLKNQYTGRLAILKGELSELEKKRFKDEAAFRKEIESLNKRIKILQNAL